MYHGFWGRVFFIAEGTIMQRKCHTYTCIVSVRSIYIVLVTLRLDA